MLDITPAMMEAAYNLLLTTPPFRDWKMPPADEVEFHVCSFKDRGGDYFRKDDGTHVIRANLKWCGALDRLMTLMAHEMTHMHVDLECPTDQAHHGGRFMAAARSVCRHHVWDLKRF